MTDETLSRRATLKDGTTILMRPITPDDEERMLELFHAFSRQTIYQRWFHVKEYMPREQLKKYLHNDLERDMALLAVYEDWDGEFPVGVGRYSFNEVNRSAEIAVVVRDDWQNKGVGTALVRFLTDIARSRGVRGFTAEVLTGNTAMLRVFESMGFFINKDLVDGVYRLRMFFDDA
jgi:RimJ/RimL family protein N-acetyltransferase